MGSGFVHISDERLSFLEDLSLAELAHLESCRECMARLRDLEFVTNAYQQYRQAIRDPALPPPPRPWKSFEALIAQQELPGRRYLRWWQIGAVAAAIVIAIALAHLYQASTASSVRVNDLLARSSNVTLPEGRRISMRLQGRTMMRPAVLTEEAPATNEPDAERFRSLFTNAHYSWRDPLSARSFLAWRNSLQRKRDKVSVVQTGGRQAYRIETRNFSGMLRTASLIVRDEDMRPTEGAFEFEGEGTLEISEAPRQPVPSSIGSHLKEAPQERPAGPEDTLRVLVALNAIAADVGQPIAISEASGRIVVQGSGLSARRQEEIVRVLKPLPRVTVDFDTPGVNSIPSRESKQYSANMPQSLRTALEAQFGGAIALQEMTDNVLDATGSLLSRAYALQVLAEKFPPGIERELSVEATATLTVLRGRHYAELISLFSQLQLQLKPLLVTSTSSSPLQETNPSMRTTWQSSIPALTAAAKEADAVLNHLLAGSYSQSKGEEMIGGLSSRIEELRRTIQLQQPGQ